MNTTDQDPFADDTALVVGSAEHLPCLLTEFARVYKWRKLRVNVEKSKVTEVGREGLVLQVKFEINGGVLW